MRGDGSNLAAWIFWSHGTVIVKIIRLQKAKIKILHFAYLASSLILNRHGKLEVKHHDWMMLASLRFAIKALGSVWRTSEGAQS